MTYNQIITPKYYFLSIAFGGICTIFNVQFFLIKYLWICYNIMYYIPYSIKGEKSVLFHHKLQWQEVKPFCPPSINLCSIYIHHFFFCPSLCTTHKHFVNVQPSNCFLPFSLFFSTLAWTCRRKTCKPYTSQQLQVIQVCYLE